MTKLGHYQRQNELAYFLNILNVCKKKLQSIIKLCVIATGYVGLLCPTRLNFYYVLR